MGSNGDHASESAPPRWDPAARAGLTKRFFASDYGAPLDDPDRRRLFQSVLRYAVHWSAGGPLDWNPGEVATLLGSWIPANILGEVGYLALAPALIRGFVRFAHEEQGVSAYRTRRTLEAIERIEPSFENSIRSESARRRYAWSYEEGGSGSSKVNKLCDAVGGLAELRRLDAEPLPDSTFDWSGIPDEVRGVVGEILTLTDHCCDEMFDTEYRTACRRLLARAASGDPSLFRRSGRVDKAAAAVMWCVCTANGLLRDTTGSAVCAERRLPARELLAHFGTLRGGVSERAAALLRAADPDDDMYRRARGSADFLVSATRRQLVAFRERHLDDLAL